jgi:hypothetical protein
MKRTHFVVLTIAYLSFTLQGCNFQQKKNGTNQLVEQTLITKETAIKIFNELTGIELINCIVTTLDGKECIICLANKIGIDGPDKMHYINADIVYYKLSKFANAWRIETQKSVFKEELTCVEFYNDFEIITLDNKPYLYFLYRLSPMGNAISFTELNFSLFSLTDFHLTTLDYGGEPVYGKFSSLQKIKGDFTNLIELSSKPDLLRLLESKASQSTLVYRATSRDLEINSSENYEKKWQLDNSSVKTVWDVKDNTFEEPLRITYYDNSIFPTEQGCIDGTIENNKYKVITLFRNNILGYDKIKKKFFPIWVEGCMHGCNKEVSFANETTLKIVYSEAENEIITVDLAKMCYKITLK